MKTVNIKSIKKINYKGLVYDISFDQDPFFFATSNIDNDFINSCKTGICIHNSSPDIDVDFEAGTDHIVDEFLYRKYGKERVLSVSTFSTFNEKGCLKDVARAHGLDAGFESDVFAVTKEMPNFDKVDYDLKRWFEEWPSNPSCSPRVKNWLTDPRNKKMLEQTLKLQGQIRGIGQHAAGIVITPSESWNYLPTNIIATNKSIVTAYQEADKSGKDLSALGILKLDRLKLETLNVIKEAIQNIKNIRGIDIKDKIDYIDLKDPNLFQELRLGFNHGIFQFESPGMNALIKGIRVESFEELVAANALYRPGPMGIGAHEEYIKNKFHPNEIQYVHKSLEPILKETNGVMIYQEQLMFLADSVGRMGLGNGDILRRYMDKASSIIAKASKGEELTEKEKENKDYKAFQKYWDMFLEGAEKQGYSKEEIDKVKDWIIKYLGYSFNKCLTKNHEVISEKRGKINILEVKKGEKILGFNIETQKDEFNPVKDVIENGVKKVYKIKTKSGKILECTEDHKILTPDGMRPLWEIIQNKLKVKINEKFEEIIEIEEIGLFPTYDLEIDSKFHNFYANNICVSNSHSLSYAYLAMQTLYLKHYYPVEFYTALLNHPKTSGGKEKEQDWLAAAISSALSKGIKILPPSRKSGWKWTQTGEREISMGLSAINGLGEIAYSELLDMLKFKGKSFEEIERNDFFQLPFSKYNKKAFESCVKAGVFDEWSTSREELYDMWEKRASNKSKVAANQMTMFDLAQFYAPKLDINKYIPTPEETKISDFVEVCNFNLKNIEKATKIKEQIIEKSGGKISESVTNFGGDGYYYFVLEDFTLTYSVKGKKYYNLKIGNGVSTITMRMFEPMASGVEGEFEKGGIYVAYFEKRGDFINFKNKKFFKKLKGNG